jgi:hypothetical protein
MHSARNSKTKVHFTAVVDGDQTFHRSIQGLITLVYFASTVLFIIHNLKRLPQTSTKLIRYLLKESA